ncbi:MAG: chorismate-binding protein, partial [Planctomycetia bacterium]
MSIEPRPAAAGADPSAWITRRFFTASGAAVAEFAPGIEPAMVFQRLARGRYCLFLDSAQPPGAAAGLTTAPRLDRHSFVAVDPIHSIELAADATADTLADAFARLRRLLADLACPTIPGLPSFQGGVAGLVSYECGLVQLGLPSGRPSAAATPLVSLHVFDTVCGFDHDSGRGWIVSQGVPARGPAARRARAEERLASLRAALGRPGGGVDAPRQAAAGGRDRRVRHPSEGHVVEGFTGPGDGPLVSTQSPESHRELVRAGIEMVRAGDVFQVNLAQQFTLPTSLDPVALHLRGRLLNPAPFAGFFAAGPATVVSMSPERLLQVERRTVRMHPIKGTRRMLALPEADLYAGEDL